MVSPNILRVWHSSSWLFLLHPTHSTTCLMIWYTKPHAKAGQSNLLLFFIQISQYLIWAKHNIHQKAESWSASSLSKSDNTVNNNLTFNTKWAEFSTKWWVLLHFTSPYLFIPIQFLRSLFVYFSQFSLPYMITKSPLQSPPTLLFPIPQPLFTSLFLHIVISTILTKKVFPYHFASSGCIKGPMNKWVLTLRADTVTFLPTFPSMA